MGTYSSEGGASELKVLRLWRGKLLLADRRIGSLPNCFIRLERCTECAADGGERCHEPGERGIVGKARIVADRARKHVRSDDELRSAENQRKQGDVQGDDADRDARRCRKVEEHDLV